MKNKSGFSALCKVGSSAAYLGGVCILAAAGVSGPGLVPAAQAREAAGFFGQFGGYEDAFPAQSDFHRPRRSPNRARQAPKQPVKGGKQQAEKKAAPPPPGPHMLIVSIKSQRITLYANGRNVATAPVSSGTASHPTPHGVFSVIQRSRHHRSNIYSGAPMPYMQRLTWSGVALHQGVLPGHPASHGCIRLPESFASFLWNTTKMNTRVIVAREDVEPHDIAHPRLFQPKPVPTTVESPLQDLRKTFDTTHPPVRNAGMQVVITNALAAEADKGVEGKPAEPAKSEPKAEPKPDAAATVFPQPADIPDAILASFEKSLAAKAKRVGPTGPISVFISRKDKRLYVRQAFIPLFSAGVTFKDDTAPVGTHVFTAYDQDDGKSLRWAAVTLPAEAAAAEKVKPSFRIDARGRRIEAPARLSKATESHSGPVPSAASVLDRIEIPQDVVDRISYYMSPGASVIVADQGIGYETGLYTDFIVVTKK